MASYNWNSISKKIQSAMKSPDVKKKIDQCVEDKISVNAEKASEVFIDILKRNIESCAGEDYASGQLGSSAINAILSLNFKSSKPYGMGDKYYINISFDGDKFRESLVPDKYGGVDNIVALLNSGYSAGHTVYGVWNGHTDNKIPSLAERGGAHFIEQAVAEFMSSYAKLYGVTDIEVADIYN